MSEEHEDAESLKPWAGEQRKKKQKTMSRLLNILQQSIFNLILDLKISLQQLHSFEAHIFLELTLALLPHQPTSITLHQLFLL